MSSSHTPSVSMVTDPHDHRPRPFCGTIGKLVAFAMASNRYLAPTREEDVIWQASGRLLIEQRQGIPSEPTLQPKPARPVLSLPKKAPA